MASGNSLGNASIILTTEAQGLTSGLKKAQGDIGKFKTSSEKTTGGIGKSFKALGPLLAAAGIGIAAKLIDEQLTSMADAIREGKSGLNSIDSQKILQAEASVKKLKEAFFSLISKVMVAFAPLIEIIADNLKLALEAITPILTWIARVASTSLGIIVDVIGEIISAVWEVIKAIAEWIGEVTGLSETSLTVEEVVVSVFRAIGIAIAYVWDVLKAGAAVIAYIASFIVEGFGKVVSVLADVLSLAKELPEEIRPSWVDDAVNGVERFAGKVTGAAGDMRNWAKGVFNNFGNSADDVRNWFDKRQNRVKAAIEIEVKPIEYKATAAMTQGSKEAYSVITKFQTENMLNPQLKIAKEQLDAQKQGNAILGMIKEAVGGIGFNVAAF